MIDTGMFDGAFEGSENLGSYVSDCSETEISICCDSNHPSSRMQITSCRITLVLSLRSTRIARSSRELYGLN